MTTSSAVIAVARSRRAFFIAEHLPGTAGRFCAFPLTAHEIRSPLGLRITILTCITATCIRTNQHTIYRGRSIAAFIVIAGITFILALPSSTSLDLCVRRLDAVAVRSAIATEILVILEILTRRYGIGTAVCLRCRAKT